MKVTYNWLKDFVEIKIFPQALAEKLTMAGLEVTALEEREGDFVFEIEVTSNRPDCLNVIGVAREVAAITGKKLKKVSSIKYQVSSKSLQLKAYRLKLEVENKKDCPLYTAKIIKDVKVGPSPDWLKKRLELIGCRSVNNAVDITNYILFTFGEPLHAFDLDKIVSPSGPQAVSPLKITVRRAKNGEEIATIDGIKRSLDEDVLIIASDIEKKTGRLADWQTGRPIAIAGIMGGRDTEVTENTKNILLEAAIFNPIIVRRVRQRLGLESESSYRFERGIDLESVKLASGQAVRLIQETCGGDYTLAKESILIKTRKKKINLDTQSVNKILGINITSPKIKNILNNLGFKVKERGKNNFIVEVPHHRLDVGLEIDLIEEIARLYGYAQIPKTLPKVSPDVTASNTRDLVSLVKNILMGLGLNEVITYSLIDKEVLGILEKDTISSTIEILNPLSEEQEILRPTITAGLLKCIATNLNQKQDYVSIFEIAKIFSSLSGNPQEELVLAIALCGEKSFLSSQGRIKEEFGFLHLKGILEILLKRLGIKNYSFNPTNKASEIMVCVNKENLGRMAILKGSILERFGIKNKEVFLGELVLDKLFSYAQLKKKFVPLSIYPGITRDISLILPENIKADDIQEAVKKRGGPLLREIKIIDYYKGKQIPAGFKGLTISCLYRSQERTLTEEEINPLHSLVCAVLVDRFRAKTR